MPKKVKEDPKKEEKKGGKAAPVEEKGKPAPGKEKGKAVPAKGKEDPKKAKKSKK